MTDIRRAGRAPASYWASSWGDAHSISDLTVREREILDALLMHGRQDAAATSLGVTRNTVRNMSSAILIKLDVRSIGQALVLYDRWKRGGADPS